jgi:putative FmdB family regulatory protein
MPTYEYECTRCGITIEEFKPMSAPRRQRCPECRGKVERLISGGMGVLFKGSGFYVNDSRGTKEKKSKNSPVAGATDSGSGKADVKDTPSSST